MKDVYHLQAEEECIIMSSCLRSVSTETTSESELCVQGSFQKLETQQAGQGGGGVGGSHRASTFSGISRTEVILDRLLLHGARKEEEGAHPSFCGCGLSPGREV